MLILLYCILGKETVPFDINLNFFIGLCSFLVKFCTLFTFLQKNLYFIGNLTANFFERKGLFSCRVHMEK